MPNLSSANRAAAKKQEKEEAANEEKQDAPKDTDVVVMGGRPDPSDDIPIKSMANAKDPFADAYPPGQKPPEDLDSL